MSVPSPPMVPAYPIAKSKVFSNFLMLDEFLPSDKVSASRIKASPIGTIIITAAVFDTNILIIPVASMKPRIIRDVVVPIKLIIFNAIRVCKFQRSIAMAIIKPPMNKKIISFPYELDTVPLSITFPIGNSTRGSNEVTGIGIASVIHHVAIHRVEAKTKIAGISRFAGRKNNNVSRKRSGPNTNPINWNVL